MTNFKRTVLYTGVSSNLIKGVFEHKQELVEGFTQKYKTHDLIYFEIYENPDLAFEREKQIKRWNRRKKQALIATVNPSLKDLYSNLV